MEAIDAVKINFDQEQLFILNICLAFLMFGVALDLKLDNFKTLFQKPKAPLVGLFSQLLVLPLLTLLLIFLFKPPVSISLGMVLVACCPGGNVSNFAVHLAKANAALSILLTSITTLGAIFITPLYFHYLVPIIPGSENFSQVVYIEPSQMVATIFQLILLPLAIGMLFNYRFANFTNRIKGPVKVLSILIFLSFIFFAVYANFNHIVNYLHIVFLLVLVHNATAIISGYWIAKFNDLPQNDARTIALETGIQNSGLGLILIFNFFNGLGGMAMIAAWWGIWHLVAAFSLAMWWNNRPVVSLDNT